MYLGIFDPELNARGVAKIHGWRSSTCSGVRRYLLLTAFSIDRYCVGWWSSLVVCQVWLRTTSIFCDVSVGSERIREHSRHAT